MLKIIQSVNLFINTPNIDLIESSKLGSVSLTINKPVTMSKNSEIGSLSLCLDIIKEENITTNIF